MDSFSQAGGGANTVQNFLAAGIEITGKIRFNNSMQIDGQVDGEIFSETGQVTIGESAKINGDVTAREVCIYGSVKGQVKATRCSLKQQAILKGDLYTETLSMEEGAKLSGHTEIG